jgi:pimeloyl-ACP methyl ester carboxylesterase
MSSIAVGRENSSSIDLYYEDHGSGRPVVLVHGWPLSGTSWEKQVAALLPAGYRVVTYDRRGFGQSGRPTKGYDYDTLADDLHKLLTHLDLYEVTLVGFAMGTGEVARYLGAYGSKRVRSTVFLASVPPFLLKTPDNPGGVEVEVIESMKQSLAADRPAYLARFLADFYDFHVFGGERVSEQIVQLSWNVAAAASPTGTLDCVSAWTTDFRNDLRRVDVPALVVHGNADRILPIAATGVPLHDRLRRSRLVVIEGGPHGFIWTHAEQVNRELLDFLGQQP